MDGWNKWLGKKIFLRTKNSSHPYSGNVVEISPEDKPIVWMTIVDKYNKFVTFSVTEIIEIKEEE
jgi:hypothetical protein